MSEKPSRNAATSRAVPARIRLAELLGFVALVAALVGALGPADEQSTTYSWPPPELPETAPSRVWYTPLLLQRRIPDSLEASIPCSAQPALPGADRPLIVLATARYPERARGLAVRQAGDRLVLTVGDVFLGYLPLTQAGLDGDGCSYRITVADSRWSVAEGPSGTAFGGELERMPVVNGLFSGIDLSAGQAPTVRVTTEVHGVDPTVRQTVAWILAALCALAALLLVAAGRRRPIALLSRTRRIVAQAHPVDAAVGALLLVWWVISPAFWDDGWTIARQEAFTTTGGFSNYYDSYGAPLPIGFWFEWLQHWLTQSTTAILLLRLPALLCLAGTWLLVRWIFSRQLITVVATSSVGLWTLAAAFAVGAMAWGMTLRLEPLVALLVTGVMACAIRFVESRQPAPLILAAVLVPLAVSAHPAGIVSLAPLIAVAPALIGWARRAVPVATAIVISALALVLVLGFVGSDIRQRSYDAQVIDEASTTVASWRDEILRYDAFSPVRSAEFDGYGVPLRRMSLGLMVLALLALFLRLGRRRSAPFDYVPTAALGIALLLLVTTPSKWPWHFGSLIGLVALAIAVETGRLASAQSGRTLSRAILVLLATVVVVAWSWSPQRLWGPVDLRTLDWSRVADDYPLVPAAIVVPLLLLAAVVARRRRAGADPGGDVVSQAAPWILPALLLPMIAFTVAIFVADAAKTPSWTLTRQTLGGLRGEVGCGLADDLRVVREGTVRPAVGKPFAAGPVPEWVPSSPVPGAERFAIGPASTGLARSPWFSLPRGDRFGLYLGGSPGEFDRMTIEWGRLERGRVDLLSTSPVDLRVPPALEATVPWQLITAGELPPVPERATSLRVLVRSESSPGPAIAVTSPVVYETQALSRRLDAARTPALVFPEVRMYFPCARLPRLVDGTAEEAPLIITTTDSLIPVRYASSPFAGLLDLYPIEALSVRDSEDPPAELVVFGIESAIPGGRLLPPRAIPAT